MRGLVAPAPADEPREARLVLDAQARLLEVFALRSDHETPAAGDTVRLRWERHAGAATPGDDAEVETVRLDDAGYAQVAVRERARVTVAAPAAAFGDPAPHTAVVPLPSTAEATFCHAVTVVSPEPLATLALRVEIRGHDGAETPAPPGASHAVLALRRLDDGSFRTWPCPERLVVGAVLTARLRVPAGSYEVASWPTGAFEITAGGVLRVVADHDGVQRHRVLLEVTEGRQELELDGIAPTDLPLHVTACADEDLLLDDLRGAFTGPWLWRRIRQTTSVLPDDGLLLAFGQHATYLGRLSPATPQATTRVVDMQPATLVEVVWPRPRTGGRGAWLEAECDALGLRILPMGREMARDGEGRQAPALVGRATLPQGTAELRVVLQGPEDAPDADARVVWRQRVELDEARRVCHVAHLP